MRSRKVRVSYAVVGLKECQRLAEAQGQTISRSPDSLLLKSRNNRLETLGFHLRIRQLETCQVSEMSAIEVRGHLWKAKNKRREAILEEGKHTAEGMVIQIRRYWRIKDGGIRGFQHFLPDCSTSQRW